MWKSTFIFVLGWFLLPACQSFETAAIEGVDYRTFRTADEQPVTLEELSQQLAEYDAVFLGEFHDSEICHQLQYEVTARLHELRPDMILSLEMFEWDVQTELDRYLEGNQSEEDFLAASRPWKNYSEHYRPVVEFARANQISVIAANAPKALVSTVAKEGLSAVINEDFMPTEVYLGAGEYRQRFEEAMQSHGGEFDAQKMDRWYASQCLRDSAMAEAIAAQYSTHKHPLVVHWCGRFHSDAHLGTVERLRRLWPELRIAVVTTVKEENLDRPLSEAEQQEGEFVWLVLPQNSANKRSGSE